MRTEGRIPKVKTTLVRQAGLTLIELVMAMAVATIVMAAASYTILQIINTNTRNSNHMVAVRQVQNAGYWLSHDGEMANTVTANLSLPALLNLTWRDPTSPFEPSLNHASRFTLENPIDDDPRSEVTTITYTLWRDVDGTKAPVAEHINSLTIMYYPKDHKLICSVTATVARRGIPEIEARVYTVNPRSDR